MSVKKVVEINTTKITTPTVIEFFLLFNKTCSVLMSSSTTLTILPLLDISLPPNSSVIYKNFPHHLISDRQISKPDTKSNVL
jgi:hypothetical protein